MPSLQSETLELETALVRPGNPNGHLEAVLSSIDPADTAPMSIRTPEVVSPPSQPTGGEVVRTMIQDAPDAPADDSGAAFENDRGPLRVRALKVAMWGIGGFGASQVIRLASNVVLARLLFPQDFGLMAIVMVWIQGLEMFTDIGLGPGVVRSRRGLDPDFVNTAFTMSVMRGGLLMVCGCLLAWPVSVIYEEPILAAMMPAVALTGLIGGCRSMTTTLLLRDMKAAYVSVIDIGSQLTSTTVMIVWALISPTVWALVAGAVAGTLVRTILGHVVVIVPVRFRWEREAVHELYHFGKWIFISTLITFFALQSDRLIGGKIIPLAMFGVYTFAVQLTNLPKQVITRISRDAIFPLFAIAERSTPEQLNEQLRRARYLLLPMMFVLTLATVSGGRLFFQLLYPADYQAAGWMTQLMAVFLWFAILIETDGSVLLAMGDSRSLALSNAVRAVTTIAGVLAGFSLAGMVGFILGLTAGVIASYSIIAIAMKRRGLPVFAVDVCYTLGLVAAALAVIPLFDLTALQPGWRQYLGAVAVPFVPGLWVLYRVWTVYGRKT